MAKPTGFLEFGRETPTRRPVGERVHDLTPGDAVFGIDNTFASRAIDAGEPDTAIPALVDALVKVRATGRPTIATPHTRSPSAQATANNPDNGGTWCL